VLTSLGAWRLKTHARTHRYTQVGVGKPLTQHFSRYAPDDMPVVVYDSKGLEQGFHEEFVAGACVPLPYLLNADLYDRRAVCVCVCVCARARAVMRVRSCGLAPDTGLAVY
jgi:hypothetical protein